MFIADDNCTRLLLVADPQILGETFDENGYNSLAIFDNDRFLSSSYGNAIAHARPDAVIFLGDLMDEGSVATTEQYERYAKRFRKIFSAQSTDVQVGRGAIRNLHIYNSQRFLK